MIRVTRANWHLPDSAVLCVVLAVAALDSEVFRIIADASLSVRMRVCVHAWLRVRA
jgi:hypothetical protein